MTSSPKSVISMPTLCIPGPWNKWFFSNFGPKELTEFLLIRPPGKKKKCKPGGGLCATSDSSANFTIWRCSPLELSTRTSKTCSRLLTRSPWSYCAGCWQRLARTWSARQSIGLTRWTKPRKWYVCNLRFDFKGRFWTWSVLILFMLK